MLTDQLIQSKLSEKLIEPKALLPIVQVSSFPSFSPLSHVHVLFKALPHHSKPNKITVLSRESRVHLGSKEKRISLAHEALQ